MAICYECHTKRTEIVRVAEDMQQHGLYAAQGDDHDQAVEMYTRAREVLLSDPELECRKHVPPLYCAATNEKSGWGDVKVWLPSLFGTYLMMCSVCKERRPCIDCDHVEVQMRGVQHVSRKGP